MTFTIFSSQIQPHNQKSFTPTIIQAQAGNSYPLTPAMIGQHGTPCGTSTCYEFYLVRDSNGMMYLHFGNQPAVGTSWFKFELF